MFFFAVGNNIDRTAFGVHPDPQVGGGENVYGAIVPELYDAGKKGVRQAGLRGVRIAGFVQARLKRQNRIGSVFRFKL